MAFWKQSQANVAKWSKWDDLFYWYVAQIAIVKFQLPLRYYSTTAADGKTFS